MVSGNGQSKGDDELDLAAELGAQDNYSTQCFTIYIPNKDKNGKEFGTQRRWILEALALLTELPKDAEKKDEKKGDKKDQKK